LIWTSVFNIVDIAGVEFPDVKSYLVLLEDALSHVGRSVEKDDVGEALLARATVGVRLVEVRLREARVPFLGVEDFVLCVDEEVRPTSSVSTRSASMLKMPKSRPRRR
jgi:hypothetical protein